MEFFNTKGKEHREQLRRIKAKKRAIEKKEKAVIKAQINKIEAEEKGRRRDATVKNATILYLITVANKFFTDENIDKIFAKPWLFIILIAVVLISVVFLPEILDLLNQ